MLFFSATLIYPLSYSEGMGLQSTLEVSIRALAGTSLKTSRRYVTARLQHW